MADMLPSLWQPSSRPGLFGARTASFKLALGLLLACWAVLVDHPLALGLPVVAIYLLSLGEHLNRAQRQLWWGGTLLTVWALVLSQGLFYDRIPRQALLTFIAPHPEWPLAFGGLRIYREGLLYGGTQALRFLALLGTGLLTCFTTELHALLGGLSSLGMPPVWVS
ncbi:MAG: energy-coupling factor transporter transmembrane component T [bacterium]